MLESRDGVSMADNTFAINANYCATHLDAC